MQLRTRNHIYRTRSDRTGETMPTAPKVGLDRSKTGRAKGTPNKTTAVLKDAILLAAEQVGEDGSGDGKLVGYLRRVAREDVKAFSGLLGKVLPMQVTGEGGGPLVIEITRFADRTP